MHELNILLKINKFTYLAFKYNCIHNVVFKEVYKIHIQNYIAKSHCGTTQTPTKVNTVTIMKRLFTKQIQILIIYTTVILLFSQQ